jgi:hypothetical protein
MLIANGILLTQSYHAHIFANYWKPDDLVARATTKQLAEDRIYFIGGQFHTCLLCVRLGPFSLHWRQISVFLWRFAADPRWPSSWHQIPWDNLWYSVFGNTPLTGLTNPLSFFGSWDTSVFPVPIKTGITLSWCSFFVCLYVRDGFKLLSVRWDSRWKPAHLILFPSSWDP